MQKVTKNYILNLSYNILILLVPLVTTPYISRILGAEGIGLYNYCLSISTYFIVAGTLGLPLYGKREIACVRDNKDSLNHLFSELISLQFILIGTSTILFCIVALLYKEYTLMLLTCGVGIVAAIFDVSWLYIGLEDFSTIVTRGILFKITSVALIFLLVKTNEDVYVYGLSIMVANFVGNVWMLILSRKKAKYIRPKIKNIFSHVRPAIILLLPNVVTTIYAVIDKTLLGVLSQDMREVGYYEQSQKIITLSLAVVTSLGTILMPRIASLFSKKEGEEIKKYLEKGIRVLSLIAIPLSFGLCFISDNLVPWFYGVGYEKVKVLLKIFSPMIFFMGISDLIGTQVLIAFKMEKRLFRINAITCALNIFLDIMLIPKHASYGAAIATLISEIMKTVVCFFYVMKKFSFSLKQFSCEKYFISSIIMAACIFAMSVFVIVESSIKNTIILIFIGVVTYFCLLRLLKDDLLLSVENKIIRKVKKKRS